MKMKLRDLYTRFVVLSCIPMNIVLAVVMTAYAHYKWQAPVADCLRMWYHANLRLFYYGIGYNKKEKEHQERFDAIMSCLFEERGLH